MSSYEQEPVGIGEKYFYIRSNLTIRYAEAFGWVHNFETDEITVHLRGKDSLEESVSLSRVFWSLQEARAANNILKTCKVKYCVKDEEPEEVFDRNLNYLYSEYMKNYNESKESNNESKKPIVNTKQAIGLLILCIIIVGSYVLY